MMSNQSKILVIVMCWLSVSIASAQRLTNVRPVTPPAEYSTPKWSPDGSRLLFTNSHNSQLFVMSLEKGATIEELASGNGIGYKARWEDDGRTVTYKEKVPNISTRGTTLQIKQVDIKSKNVTHRRGAGMEDKRSAALGSTDGLMVYINQKTLQLEMRRPGEDEVHVITKDPGQYYYPIVSPDGRQVVVHEGNSIYLYSLSENEPRKYMGPGLASAWMPDGSGIMTFEDTSTDGHTISASELYVIGKSNASKQQLTFSDDLIEMWPDVSPDGKRIAFSDERSGRIYIADINQ